MNSVPLVSVCVITYNHEKFIRQALEGIFMQKVDFPIEVIIADDCSSDATRDIILEYKEKYPEIIKLIFQKKNVGPTKNWLDLISSPIGKYLAYFEGDDYWTDPLKLQKQVDLLEKNTESSMCVALHSQLSENGLSCEAKYDGETGINLNFPSVHEHYFHTSTYLIRIDLLRKIIKKYKHLMIGDTAWRYLLSAEGSFVLLNDHVSVYRLSGTGIWTSLNDFEKAFAHYNLYSKLRKKHIRTRNSYYLNHEIDYLKSMLEVSEKKDLFYLLKYKYLLLLKNKKTYYPTVKNLKRIIKQIIRK